MKLPENSLLAKWVAKGGVDRVPHPWRLAPADERLFGRVESLVWISTPGEPTPVRLPRVTYLTNPHAFMLICDDVDLHNSLLWHLVYNAEIHPGDAMYPGVSYASYTRWNAWGTVGNCWRYKQPLPAAVLATTATPVDEDAAERERQRRFFFGPRWTGGMR